MKQIFLAYESGYTFSAYAVKYFTYNLNTYFVYTLKEIDEKGYIKLYVVKIMEELNEKVSQTIRKTDEWDKMKMIIKKLIDEIRQQNIINFKILDANELNGLTIYENREFRISQDLVEVLSREVTPLEEQNDILSQLLVDDSKIDNNVVETLNVTTTDDLEVLDLEEIYDMSDKETNGNNITNIENDNSEEIEVLEI